MMIIILDNKANKTEIQQMSKEFAGYIKIVVDIEKKMLAGGAERHFDLEQKLLEEGSIQKDLWDGGIDLETREIDHNSMINLRPRDNNPSRDILSEEIRLKFDKIVKYIIL